jgi:AcrR family transcriptional regulator
VGLREKKAEKTRRRIVNDALQLFKRDGYEETTMEVIAEAAEVSPSTLYRYFPSKDLILLDPMSGYLDFSVAFSGNSANLPAEEALAEAVLVWAKRQDANAEEILVVRSLIDQAPIPRARLWDIMYQKQRDLNARLAEKLHLPVDDLQVELSARLLFTIIGTVADHWRTNSGKFSSVAYAKKVLRMFDEQKVLIPRRSPR